MKYTDTLREFADALDARDWYTVGKLGYYVTYYHPPQIVMTTEGAFPLYMRGWYETEGTRK